MSLYIVDQVLTHKPSETHQSRTVTIAGHTKFLLPVAGTYVSPVSQPVHMEDEESLRISRVSLHHTGVNCLALET